MKSENDGLVPYHPNNMAPRMFNTAITAQHASHTSKEKMNNTEYHKLQEFRDDVNLMFKKLLPLQSTGTRHFRHGKEI